jgi:hypothetical protein
LTEDKWKEFVTYWLWWTASAFEIFQIIVKAKQKT